MERKIPAPQEIYRHFKGNLYQIITIAIHSETGEDMVVYQALYGEFKVYVRPLSMFMEMHESGVYRFEKYEIAATSNDEEVEIVEEEIPAEPIAGNIEETNSYEGVNADLLDFLDANTYVERKNLLIAMKPRLTDRLIDDLAVSLDISVPEGDIEARYTSLLSAITTFGKYEISRD